MPIAVSWLSYITAIFAFLILLVQLIRWTRSEESDRKARELAQETLAEVRRTNGRLAKLEQWVHDHELSDEREFAYIKAEVAAKAGGIHEEFERIRDRLDRFMDNRLRTRHDDTENE